ncbi:MAG: FmdB family zinc ribbon protein [Thermoanaerobaculia bacterium]|nr:FmdB family zinc ribbon protein [Thermoanaerobaculia bacterium]
MPIYEYRCESCGERTEAIQSFDDPPLAVCPHCGGPLKKLMSAPAFQFKGTGWYVTDYAGKGRKGGEEKAAGGEEKAAGAESGGKGGEGKESSTSSPKKEPKSGGGSASSSGSPSE